jgi:hypothetical protein
MSETRWRRIEPERTEPRRSFAGVLRDEPRSRAATGGRRWEPFVAAEAADDCASDDDGVADGVRSAYRVLDEQIRRGQRIAREQAERLCGPAWEDPRHAMEQSMRTYFDAALDMWMQWVDLTAATVRFDEWWGRDLGVPGFGPAARQPVRPHAEPPTGGVPVTVEVTGDRPTRVWTDLAPAVLTTPVTLQPLRSVSVEHPPLMDVTLTHEPARPPLVRVRVPAGQPAGQYHGFVLDAHSGARLGILTVEIVAPV